jgi:beta-aspartyl-dipeptidase (metallo-type)
VALSPALTGSEVRKQWLNPPHCWLNLTAILIDFTTSTVQRFLDQGEVKCSTGLKEMLKNGVPIEQITFTSDGQASLPEFDKNGEFIGLQIGKVTTLYKEVRDALINEGIQLETALQVITSNPENVLKLKQKGHVSVNCDADLVLLNKEDLTIDTVVARGKVMFQEGVVKVKGTFE